MAKRYPSASNTLCCCHVGTWLLMPLRCWSEAASPSAGHTQPVLNRKLNRVVPQISWMAAHAWHLTLTSTTHPPMTTWAMRPPRARTCPQTCGYLLQPRNDCTLEHERTNLRRRITTGVLQNTLC